MKSILPEGLRRKLDVADFGTPIQTITTYQVGDRVRMVIEPKGPWEHSAYQSDSQFVVEVRPQKVDTSKLSQGPSFTGEKLSLNFQNIEVRSLLQVIADFTNFNIITSDSVTGSVTLRLSGHYLPLGTIAWGLSLYFLFGNLEFLGGHTGMSGVPSLMVGGVALRSVRELGLLTWGVLLLILWALHNLLDSREGRAIRSLKTGRVMAESMGIDTARYRLKVFVLAALLASLSGWMYAHLQRFVNPTPFNLNIGIEYLFMAVVGGAGHLWGALLGAALITLMKQYLQDILPALLGSSGNFEVIVFGMLMLLVLQRFSQGMWPSLAGFVNRFLRPATAATLTTQRKLTERILPPRGSVVLAAAGISKRFGGLLANNEVDLDVKAGEIHALIGPNGAGKSTFFNMISGVDDPSAGTVKLLGSDMHGKSSRAFAAGGLSRTFQHVRLLGPRSVLDNVALGAHLRARSGWMAAMLRLDRGEEAALMREAQQLSLIHI